MYVQGQGTYTSLQLIMIAQALIKAQYFLFFSVLASKLHVNPFNYSMRQLYYDSSHTACLDT